MRKQISTLVLAGAALLASCSQEEMAPDGTESGLRPVTLSVSLDKGVQTRAANSAGDEQVSRCLVQILDVAGHPIEGYEQAQAMNGSETAGFTKSAVLNEKGSYTILFWADCGAENYTATDLTNVSKADGAEATEAIAYAAKTTWNGVSSGQSISATLKHVVSKVTVRTTAAVADGTLKINVPKVYSGYNVQTLQPATETSLSYEETLANVPANADVFSIYALTGSETQDLTLTYNVAAKKVSNVPLAPNTHIVLTGDVGKIGYTDVVLTATIDENWETRQPQVGDWYYKDGTYSSLDLRPVGNTIVGVVCGVDKKTARVIALKGYSVIRWCEQAAYGETGTSDMTDGLAATNTVLAYIKTNSKSIDDFPIFKRCQELREETGNDNWYIPASNDAINDAITNIDAINPKIKEAGGTEFTEPYYENYGDQLSYWLSREDWVTENPSVALSQNGLGKGGSVNKTNSTNMNVRFFLDFNYGE